MLSASNVNRSKSFCKTTFLLGMLIAALGACLLVGWIFDIKTIKSIFPNIVTMKANTSIELLLCGTALAFLSLDGITQSIRIMTTFIGAVITLIAIITLAEGILGWDFKIDQWLFNDVPNAAQSLAPGQMSPTTAYCFLLTGFALLLESQMISWRLRSPILFALSIVIIFIGGLSTLSYVSEYLFQFHFLHYADVSIHMAVAFIFIGIALLSLIRSQGTFRWSLDNLTAMGFVLGIISLLAVASGSYYFTNQLRQSATLVSYTEDTLKEVGELLSSLLTYENIERTYIITGDEQLLSHPEYKHEIYKNIHDLKMAFANTTQRKALLDQVEQLIIQRITWADHTILIRKLQGFAAAKQIISTGKGALLSDKIYHYLFQIRGEEYTNLEDRQKQDNMISTKTFQLLPIDIFLALTILFFGLFFLNLGLTEKRQLEQQLRQSQKMAAIGQLTGGIAHDFNNLLGIILGNLDLLLHRFKDNQAAIKNLQTAEKAVLRGSELTKRLLMFSSVQPLNPVPFSLNESIQNTINMLSRMLGPEIEVIIKLDASIPLVLVDASGFESSLLNLIVNARDAMTKGGSLSITTKLYNLRESYLPVQMKELKPGYYVCMTLSDTGHGMSPETLERVFEPFFTTKARGKGTGLGLSMVYGFAKQSGGYLKIYSELGHGTSISLYLPVVEEIPMPIRDIGVEQTKAKLNGIALAVDDEADLLEITVAYLEDMGFRVFHALDALQALDIVAQEPIIDLLVTDIIMPGGMNGIELAKKVRQLKPNVKIIYLSGFPSKGLAERSGMHINGPLLSKPYQRQDFMMLIRNEMGGNKISQLDTEGKVDS